MSSSSPFRRSRSPAAAGGGGGAIRHDNVFPTRTVQHPPPLPPQYPYPPQQQPPAAAAAAAQRHPVYYYHHYPYHYHQDPSSSFVITPDAQQQQQQVHQQTAAEHRYTYDSWQNMTRTLAHYDVCEQIGEGTYGQVYRGLCKDTGQTVALKKMLIHHGGYWGMPLQLVREIKILKRLHHPNLLELVEVVTSKGVEHLDPDDPPKPSAKGKKTGEGQQQQSDAVVVSDRDDPHEAYKGNLFLVLEYVSHDLTGLIDTGYDFQPIHIKCIVKQLLQALAYMHQNKYIHRDIKTSNVLLDEYFRLKLADFGLARSMEPPITEQLQPTASSGNSSKEHLTNKVITLWYRPPEILVGGTQYGPAVDVWSAGCILAELMLGKPLFAGKTELDQFNLIVDMLGTPDAETWKYLQTLCKRGRSTNMPMDFARPKPSRLRDKYSKKMPASALSLLEKLLEWDPSKRLTAKNALEQRYFWSEPVAPDDPSQLGRVLKEGVHFHEFQTKKKRKQAKAKGEEAREEALKNGADNEEAQAAFDKVYQGMMKQVAEEGFAFKEPETIMASAVEVAQKRGRSPSTDGRDEEELKDRRHRDRRSNSSRSRDERRRSRRDNDRHREDRRTSSEENKKKSDHLSTSESKQTAEKEQDQSKRRKNDQETNEETSEKSDDHPPEKLVSRKQEVAQSSRGSRERDDLPQGEQEGGKGRKRHRKDRSRRRKDKRRREKKDNRGDRDHGERERDRHRERERDERDRTERDRMERDRMQRDRMERDGMERDRMERDGMERVRMERGRIERDRNDRRRDYDQEPGRDYGREYDHDRDIEFDRDRHRDRHRDLDRPPWDDRGRDERYRDRGPRPPGPDDDFRRYGPDEEFRRYGPPGHRNDLPPPGDRGHFERHPPPYDDRGRYADLGRGEGHYPDRRHPPPYDERGRYADPGQGESRYPDRHHDRERYRGPGSDGRDRDRR